MSIYIANKPPEVLDQNIPNTPKKIEHGFDPPPCLNNIKKTTLLADGGFPGKVCILHPKIFWYNKICSEPKIF